MIKGFTPAVAEGPVSLVFTARADERMVMNVYKRGGIPFNAEWFGTAGTPYQLGLVGLPPRSIMLEQILLHRKAPCF